MKNRHAFFRRLATALFAAALSLATPAFASSDDDSRRESHDRHSDDGHKSGHADDSHDGKSDDHGHDDHGGKSTLRAVLVGTGTGARGEAKLKTKPRGSEFEVEAKLPFPSDALAIADKTEARDAGLTLILSRSGVAYAECDFDLHSLKGRKSRSGKAEHKIKIKERRGFVQSRSGICDVDLATAGVQQGLPAVQNGDTAAVTIDTTGATILEGVF